MKPSKRAFRNGMVAVVILEVIGAYAALYALSTLYFYAEIDASSYLAIQHMAKNAQVWLTVGLWVAYAVGMPWVVWHDWPTSQDARDAFDATHDNSLMPKLKLGDDIANFIRNKGSVQKPATTFYQDIQDIQDEPPKPAPNTPAPNTKPNEGENR